MSLYGRRDVIGERSVGDIIDQRGVLNRTIRAQVRTVDSDNGFVVLIYENMPSGGKYVTAAPLWMSFPDSKIGNPSWGRFMPQEGDLVRVSFDYNDRPIIVGYDIDAAKLGVADGHSGWPAINDEYKKAAGDENGDASKAKFAQFTPIKPGEYDFMSNGGAYIYGNNQGRLYLAGGSVSVTLIKNDLRISQRAQLLSHTADDCELRFGQVRRINSANNLDEKVSSDSDGKFKEFGVVLKKTLEAGSSQDVATFKMGNVIDDSGSAQQSSASKDARLWYQAFTDAGEEALKMVIDNVGNWDILAPNADTGVNIDFTNGPWKTKSKSTEWTISDSWVIKTPDQTFKLTNDGLEIGQNPTDMMALASLVKQEISALKDSVSNFVSTYNSHTHLVVGIQTAGSPVAHTQTAPVPTQTTLSTATSPQPVKDVKSSFVKSL